jgi:predicted dehydrogenase
MTTENSFPRRSFLKSLGTATLAAPFVTRNLMAQSPNSALRHASFGASNQAWADLSEIAKSKTVEIVAIADVDEGRAKQARTTFPQARFYRDWRELLDKEADHIDSVNVSTPDHMHAAIAMSAMQLGKHVYVEKPLAHDLFEVRKLSEYALGHNLTTQMGIQIHASSFYRMAPLLIQQGVIGKVKEVHSWCPKSWGDPAPLPEQQDPVPDGFNWDLWLGVCAARPYIGNTYYHPGNWRKRLDFGTGTFGDMGCHIFDPVFSSLLLTSPISVRSEGAPPNQWNWALNSRIRYVFPGTAHTAGQTLNVTWYDGDQTPPAEVVALLEGDRLPQIGSIFVGTEGAMVLPHWARPILYPDSKFKDFNYPQVPEGNHYLEFVTASQSRGAASAGFKYAGPLTEAVLLGGIASHFAQTTLKWNAEKLELDLPEANRFIRRDYRAGWKVKGLS